MFGAATDYSLLIISRFRDELRHTDDLDEAMSNAAQRTGPAILSAGGIVVGVMLVLGLSDYNATREMGPILALGMTVMMLAGLTLLPATLSALGRRAFWPRDPRPGADAGDGAGRRGWARAADLVGRHPVRVTVIATAILVLGALGNIGGRETLPFTEAFREPPDSVAGVTAVQQSFPPGRAAPADLVMDQPLSGDVLGPLAEVPGVDTVIPSAASDPAEGEPDLMKADVILDLDPFSDAAREQIPRIRAELDRLVAEAIKLRSAATGDEIAVLGGFTAGAHDIRQAIARDNRLIVPLALALIFLVLVALLRSVVAPLYLVGSVVLSFAFALGISSLFFTHVLGQPGSDPNLTTFAFIFLVGLGVDYNVFLISRIREERARGLANREAVQAGLERTGGVITSAGLILAGTFSSLMALTFEATFQFGFVICVGLLVDTFLVRAFLVPSIAVLLGERNWWPGSTGKRTVAT
jgi:RND superfamily putative drug exporter